ncbi:MAG: hypothetical protein M3O70_28195 [Actinomycetota bacterium]|nr:hypothetical protein [Actinomycetota bacterium]
MKQLRLLLALAFVTALFVVSPATAQQGPPGARGDLTLLVHTHSSERTLFQPPDPLPVGFREGETFTYSSIPCTREAPVNNAGFDADPNYPGVDEGPNPRPARGGQQAPPDTAPVRHIVQGTVTQLNPNNKGKVEGTITTILCEKQPGGGATEHQFVSTFKGHFDQVSDEEVNITGHWRISEGEGTFEDLKGHGKLEGTFECLSFSGPTTNCAQRQPPVYADFHAVLTGKYSDPTITT